RLRKEMEGEAIEREKESKVNVAPYLEQQIELAPPPAPLMAAKLKNKALLYAAAAVVVVALGSVGFWLLKPSPVRAQIAAPASKRAKAESRPAVDSAQTPMTSATETIDQAAQNKAFEAAVNQKLQEEMGKLQSQFNKGLDKKKPARVQESSPPV